MSGVSRRVPLSSWSDKGLHATAGRLQRLAMGPGLTRKQDYLFTSVINEMEWRYAHREERRIDMREADWACWGCDLCRVEQGRIPGEQRICYVPVKS